MSTTNGLAITLLDELAVLRDGAPLALPASRKTRALLAYLVLTRRPQRRDRLCELFWDLPDDPRGALRWSLSKLRRVVNDADTERLAADRERVVFQGDDVALDVRELSVRLEDEALAPSVLADTVERLDRPLLDGIDVPNHEAFQHWLLAERRAHDALLARAAERLALDPEADPGQALRGARIWSKTRPFEPRAGWRLLTLLRACGERAEAARQTEELAAHFREAGVEWPPAEVDLPPVAGTASGGSSSWAAARAATASAAADGATGRVADGAADGAVGGAVGGAPDGAADAAADARRLLG